MATSESADPFVSFQIYAEQLEQEDGIKDNVMDKVRELDRASRSCCMTTQSIHKPEGMKQLGKLCDQIDQDLLPIHELLRELSSLIPKDEYYRYHDCWKMSVQRLVASVAVQQFIRDNTLITYELTCDKLDMSKDRTSTDCKLHLDLQDFLHGLLSTAADLARWSVNCVTAGDYSTPHKISDYVTNLEAGFRLLNFKNDALRRRFDALKYDLRKVEEVVYDLSIRRLSSQ